MFIASTTTLRSAADRGGKAKLVRRKGHLHDIDDLETATAEHIDSFNTVVCTARWPDLPPAAFVADHYPGLTGRRAAAPHGTTGEHKILQADGPGTKQTARTTF